MDIEDAGLLARIRQGSMDEFAELVHRHQQPVLRILHRYERDHHVLEDLAQETFLKVWRALAQYDGRAPFQHWLSRITVRVALDHLRRKRRRANEVELPRLGEHALDWLRSADTPRELEAGEAREILARAMHGLSAQEQLVITLLEIEGRNVKEISALTGSSGVAVRVRALRARAKLKKALIRLEKGET